jgi:hypothetical protein
MTAQGTKVSAIAAAAAGADASVARLFADPVAALAMIHAEHAERADSLRRMPSEQTKCELESKSGCDGCPSMGPVAAECGGGCGDVVCAACVPTWLMPDGRCHICADAPASAFDLHMRAVLARPRAGAAASAPAAPPSAAGI